MNISKHFKKKSHPDNSPIVNSEPLNEDNAVIMYQNIDNPTRILFYRKQYPGKGDCEIEWIVFKKIDNELHITFKTAYAGYGEVFPAVVERETKELKLPFSQFLHLKCEEIVDILNRSFDLSIISEDCVDYYVLSKWLHSNSITSANT